MNADSTSLQISTKSSKSAKWDFYSSGFLNSVSISADGIYIVSGSHDNKAYLFERSCNTPVWTYITGGDVWSVVISADGEYIAAISSNGGLYFFDRHAAIKPSPLGQIPAFEIVPILALIGVFVVIRALIQKRRISSREKSVQKQPF
ncbi:MAG: WD40 repeat domain-containing protein [Candidatus Helarchaeota archaeon]